MHAGGSASTANVPANPIEYPIVFSRHEETVGSEAVPPVGIFTALQWLLPVFQLAGWLPKQLLCGKEALRKGGSAGVSATVKNNGEMCPHDSTTTTTSPDEVHTAKGLLEHFEPFFTKGSKVVPNGAILYTIQAFRFPTPRGPRSITRDLVEAPRKYFSPLLEKEGGGHFLCCYEDKQLLRSFTYMQLDQLRFAWVAVKELLEEHKAVQRMDGMLTGLARRDIKKNNNVESGVTNGLKNDHSTIAPDVGLLLPTASASPPVVVRPHTGSNIITGPSAEMRKTREEVRGKKYMSDLLREECAELWPHTPVRKSVVFVVEEQKAEVVGGRKGPRMYLATVELPLFNKKGGAAFFKAQQWCTTKRDAENAAAEIALRALRTIKP